MNTIVTSREAILEESRRIVMEQGIAAVNMRSVAKACGVAVGSLYNYFPSKADLISAAVEDVWRDIFHMPGGTSDFSSFIDCLTWLWDRLRKGCVKYPEFFTLHSVSFASSDREKGRQLMEESFRHMKQNLRTALEQDPAIHPDAFQEGFSRDDFIEMVFTLVLSMMLQGQEDCRPLLEMAVRCLY